MRTQCLTCKYYITQEDDCEKDYPEVCLEKYECGEYEPRFKKDECGHRYEDCRSCVPDCTNVCMRKPSECHCGFAYVCDMDRWTCDEQCDRHEDRRRLKGMEAELAKLSETKRLLDEYLAKHPGKTVDSIGPDIEALRASMDELKKKALNGNCL